MNCARCAAKDKLIGAPEIIGMLGTGGALLLCGLWTRIASLDNDKAVEEAMSEISSVYGDKAAAEILSFSARLFRLLSDEGSLEDSDGEPDTHNDAASSP